MIVKLELSNDQILAVLRWANNGDDPRPADGTDFVYDLNDVDENFRNFVDEALGEI